MGPRTGLDRCGKPRPTGIRSPDHSARSQSLYRLSYPAHIAHIVKQEHNKSQQNLNKSKMVFTAFNPLKPKLNPICYLLALLGAHHFLHVSRIRVKLLTFRLLMSYIYAYIYIYMYMEHPFLMFLDHTQRRSTVGRTPLDE